MANEKKMNAELTDEELGGVAGGVFGVSSYGAGMKKCATFDCFNPVPVNGMSDYCDDCRQKRTKAKTKTNQKLN